ISDAFNNRYKQLELELSDPNGSSFVNELSARYQILEDRDEYTAENVFWVSPDARWEKLQAAAKRPEIGKLIDDAMVAIEKDNPRLKGVLPKNYARPDLDKTRLGELLDLIGTIGLGDAESQKKDILGRVYEYFLGKFASAEGKAGGEFYTPACVVKLLVAMLEPYHGRIYDPCCGSGGMFVQSERFVLAHGGRIGDISIYGQESNPTTWRLAKMNLALRHIEADLGPEQADTFHRDLHSDLRADFILANPPFNLKDWGGDRLADDIRWKFGIPPVNNANYGWIQHMIYHLAPRGFAGFVLSNGSMSTTFSGEDLIRKGVIEADLIDCMVALPGQLFYSTQIPASLWFLARDKSNGMKRNRKGETLFIDARKMGVLRDRIHRELTTEEIDEIAKTYHSWRGQSEYGNYENISGFCYSASIDEIRKNNYLLTPGRYVGAEENIVDDEPFSEKMERLSGILFEQFKKSNEIENVVKVNLRELGYGK
ncbi:MAG TPA: N-6 DNA methylase, partial [Desulfosporosinus sp.]|nr:N-6 DNA methylase [Desulfosporosinus sp.]